MDKSNSYLSLPTAIGRHEVVSRIEDEVTSMEYRPQAVEDIKGRREILDERSVLSTHMEDVQVQDRPQGDQSRRSPKMPCCNTVSVSITVSSRVKKSHRFCPRSPQNHEGLSNQL